MKRTVERTLGIIALSLQFLVLFFGLLFFFILDSLFPEQLPKFGELWFGWFALVVHLVGLVLGVIAFKLLNRDPQNAGVLFLSTGVAMLLLTLGATFIQSVLFIIIGVMCLVRKSLRREDRIKVTNPL